jgi:MFS family permease
MYALCYLSSVARLAFCFLALAAIGGAAINGPLFASVQTLVPEHMRATSVAIIYFLANLIGMGLGPLAVGTVSDALGSAWGTESLRYALLLLSPGYMWAGWQLWQSRKTVEKDLISCPASDFLGRI